MHETKDLAAELLADIRGWWTCESVNKGRITVGHFCR